MGVGESTIHTPVPGDQFSKVIPETVVPGQEYADGAAEVLVPARDRRSERYEWPHAPWGHLPHGVVCRLLALWSWKIWLQ